MAVLRFYVEISIIFENCLILKIIKNVDKLNNMET